jgi:hypothetical protein
VETTYPFWTNLIKGMHRHCRRLRKEAENERVAEASTSSVACPISNINDDTPRFNGKLVMVPQLGSIHPLGSQSLSTPELHPTGSGGSLPSTSFADFETILVFVRRVILRIFDVSFYCFHCLQKQCFADTSVVWTSFQMIRQFLEEAQLQCLPFFPRAIGMRNGTYLCYQCHATESCTFRFSVKFIAGQQPQILVRHNFVHSCRCVY